MIGKTLGHYEITSQLGKGGMGEVFRAKDQKLGRDVAIKVLPQEFARDADRVARFQREAKLLASLNHPNIAAIYGLEESDGTNFLVLELVEGQTLAEVIAGSAGVSPASVPDILRLALQIAEALEAAHEKGVIHRDLKPANIKVTPDGKVKVLDFGLAKAFAGDRENLNLSNSPTLSNAATQQGVILGTAAYMSPEQARGKAVDKRADIWAFGCVVYEMLTGQAAFQGEDVSEILASVIKGEVKLDHLPSDLHPRVREAITRCLQKDLKSRYHDIADARYEIEQALADSGGIWVQLPAQAERLSKWRLPLSWVAAIVILAAVVSGAVVWNFRKSEPRQVTRFYHEIPKDQQYGHLLERALAVSPDGRQFAYSTAAGLYRRSIDELDARFMAGTEGAREPFFSPDGKCIGFWSSNDRKLKKVAVSGGEPVAIADAVSIGRPHWAANDTILFTQSGRGIMRVSADGGTPEELIKAGEAEGFINPQMLPDGKSVLFWTYRLNPDGRLVGTDIAVQPLRSGKRKILLEGVVGYSQYLPTGHILYATENVLMAVPFDPQKLELTGGKASMAERVARIGLWPQFAVSDSGTLVYAPESADSSIHAQRSLVWVDRNGKTESLAAQPDAYVNPRISPDGTQLALGIGSGMNSGSIWLLDLVRPTRTRLTLDKGADFSPLWTPDGKQIAYVSFRLEAGGYFLNRRAANGTGKEETIIGGLIVPSSWSRDGKTMVVTKSVLLDPLNLDIGTLSMEGGHTYKPLLQEKHTEYQPRISPDGQWMVYTSDESGRDEIYVRPFPDVEKDKRPVSTDGGHSPLWSLDGREVFYRNGDAVIAIPVNTESGFTAGAPKTLFRGVYVSLERAFSGTRDLDPWDISRDGKRFLMMKESGPAESAAAGIRRINIVLNWFEELKQRAPAK